MSNILNSFLYNMKTKNLYNTDSKYLKENKEKLNLINCGLTLSENNIFKIPYSKYKKYLMKKNYSNDNKNEDLLFDINIKPFLPNKIRNGFIQNNIRTERFNNYHLNIFNSNKSLKSHKIMPLNEQKKAIFTYLDKNKIKKKVDEILKTLYNDKKEKRENKRIMNDKSHSTKYFNEINPKAYIEYNLKTKPYNKKIFRSFEFQTKSLKNKEIFTKKIIKRIDKTNNFNMNAEKVILSKYDNDNDVIEVEKILFYNKRNFQFKNINNTTFRNHYLKPKISKKFKEEAKKYITFYEKMNNAIAHTENTIKYLNNISEKNEVMIDKIKNLYVGKK